MEQNLPVIAKRVWKIARVVYFMLRKGISKKSKLMLDLNLLFKRGKLAGKALQNLIMLHHRSLHHPNWLSSSTTANRHSHDGQVSFPILENEYEFSCSNSPADPHSLFPFNLANKRKNKHGHGSSNFFSCVHAPVIEEEDDVATVGNAVMKALERLHIEAASPALPGFGKSPMMVRQLRITDSPFPLRDVDDDSHVDEAAEEFIVKFYNDLKHQNEMAFASR